MADTAKILVVEDEVDTVGLLELTLRTAGFEMQTAHSGQEGLRLAFEKPYDYDPARPDDARHLKDRCAAQRPVPLGRDEQGRGVAGAGL